MRMAESIPGINRQVIDPVYGTESRLIWIIINLNDEHHWTREQIADWLETLDDIPTFDA